MWSKIKQWCLEQVLWAEQNMQGKSGKDKRQAVVNKLDELIRLPSYLEWADGPLLNWLVDYICEKLNWLTDYNFNAETATALAANKDKVMAALDTPMSTVAAVNEKTLDERLAEICEQYGVSLGPVSKKVPEPNPVEIDWFEKCIAFTFKYEGGANFTVVNGKPVLKSYAKADKGGPTIYGITQATLKAAYGQGVVGHKDIAKLTLDEAKAIYKKNYWTRYRWSELAWPVCLCCLDCCVNHGGFALILQRALKERGCKVTVDGKFGPETFNALKTACANPTALANAIIERRREYFRNIVEKNPTQKGFLKGWLNRCDALAAACKEV